MVPRIAQMYEAQFVEASKLHTNLNVVGSYG
jgi:hypothetical protein